MELRPHIGVRNSQLCYFPRVETTGIRVFPDFHSEIRNPVATPGDGDAGLPRRLTMTSRMTTTKD